jgi:hypothetical protein
MQDSVGAAVIAFEATPTLNSTGNGRKTREGSEAKSRGEKDEGV